MRKKLVMRKWVEVVLLIIAFITLLIVMSECENTMLFAVSHILGGIVLILIAFIFKSYGRSE